MTRSLEVADLFAGAGGCTTGALQAAERRGIACRVTAVNHWPTAVETHTRNHPEARHFCASIETLDPRAAIPSGKLDLLIAAPECTHHSSARGGRPINDQSRASAWHILRWLELLRVDHVLIENVPEFRTWGPLGAKNRPLKSGEGQTFRAFIAAVESYGYRVEWKILNAADFGAATSRRRLFIMARRGRQSIAWPASTHSKTGGRTLFGGTRKWRAAREIIDWTLPSQSIFARRKALKPATMRRIVEGLRRFGGPQLEPFLLHLTHGGRVRSVDAPLPTLTGANRGELGVAEPFIVPFLGERDGQLPRTRSVDEPLQTVTASNPIGIVEPFIAAYYGDGEGRTPRVHSLNEPLPTAPTENRFGIVEPFVLQQQSGGVARPVDQPVPTIAAKGAVSLVEPYLTKYTSTGQAYSVDQPIDTITTRDRFGLVQPVIDGYTLDIRFRMLQPHELSAAMGFPREYVFTGTKGDIVRQVGNAVVCEMARALCGAIFDAKARRPKSSEAVA